MSQVVLHYFRYISSTCTVTKGTGGTVSLPAGWYNLPSVLAALRTGSVTTTWTASSNSLTFSPSISVDSLTIRGMLGINTGAQTTNNYLPLCSFVPADPEYNQELAPYGVSGKKTYDTDFYLAQDGNTWSLGSIAKEREIFRLQFVSKNDIFSTGTSGLSAPFIDTVYRPDLGIVFELVAGDDVSCAAGYSAGAYWCHVKEPESAIQMPPWDQYFTLTFEANQYVVP